MLDCMSSSMTIQDRLDLLVALPASRLCQILCVWSQFEEQERIWSLLVWVEAQRLKRPAELSRRARTRLKKSLFPGRSLDRLLSAEAWFDPTVFELIAESILSPLLGSPATNLDPGPLVAILEGWNEGSNHPFFAVRTLLDRLPEQAAQAVIHGGRLELERRAGRAQSQKQTPRLFHVMLYLFRKDFLFVTEVVNLFGSNPKVDSTIWKRVASGLKRYYAEMKEQNPPKRGRSQSRKPG
ncbi:hypothetical protein JST97_38185 [bacterium]|nr:hypothetical protein [bacterium]